MIFTHIIWDAGGTLFDTYPATTAAFLSTLAERNIHAPAERVSGLARISQHHAAQTLALEYGLDEAWLWSAYRKHLESAPPAQQPPFPGARELCRLVQQRGGLNLIATHRARRLTERLLDAHDMRSLFAGLLSTSDGYPRKPDPALLLALVEQHRLDPAQTLAVGDREIDIQAGKNAGLLTCLYRGRGSLPADLEIHDYAELIPYLRPAAPASGI